jgi:hypothetical protein
MKWFPHDTDSTQDAKIRKLLIRHGAVGYAIYFHCLELIAAEISESNLTFELEHDSEIIADNLHIKGTADKSGIDIVQEIMRTIIGLNLFEQSQGRIFCFKLLKRVNTSMTSNERFREMITCAKAKYHDAVMTNHDAVMLPSCKTILDNTKKNNTLPNGKKDDPFFESFWTAYPRKEGKGQAKKAYTSQIKKGSTHELIMDRLKIYAAQLQAAKTERQFIRHPATFLNNLDDYEQASSEPEESEFMRLHKPKPMTDEEREMIMRSYNHA